VTITTLAVFSVVAVLAIVAIVVLSEMLSRWRIEDSIRRRELPPLIIPFRSSLESEREAQWDDAAWSPAAADAPPALAAHDADEPTGLAGSPEVAATSEPTSPAVSPVQQQAFEAPSPPTWAPPADLPRAAASPSRAEPAPARAVRSVAATRTPRPSDSERYVPVVVDDDGASPGADETVRFRRTSDEPVQLLPGRLEVLDGEKRHREIRFVRMPGEPAELILGREGGSSPQHVALESRTVSRRHARFMYRDGHWGVVNLSQTNPLVVNDEEMSAVDAPRVLVDGDRIELGDVMLRFRAR
jgi:hypothetical protein